MDMHGADSQQHTISIYCPPNLILGKSPVKTRAKKKKKKRLTDKERSLATLWVLRDLIPLHMLQLTVA